MRAHRYIRLFLATGAVCLTAAAGTPAPRAQEGQIIISRPVPSRPATRPGVPAPPLAVRTAPPVDIAPAPPVRDAVGLGLPNALVLSDTEAARMSTGAGLSLRGSVQGLGRHVGAAAGRGHRAGTIGGNPGTSPSRQVGGAAGAVSRATGGLGRTVVNSVAPR